MGHPLKAMGRPIHCLVKICIVEDNVWALSTEFKGDVLEVAPSRGLHDLSASEGRTGEGDFIDMGVLADRLTNGVPIADNEVKHTRGETSFVDHLSGHESGQGSKFGGLHDDRVSGGESGADLPAPHQDYKYVRQRVRRRECVAQIAEETHEGSSRG
jgi:hypothetical protein